MSTAFAVAVGVRDSEIIESVAGINLSGECLTLLDLLDQQSSRNFFLIGYSKYDNNWKMSSLTFDPLKWFLSIFGGVIEKSEEAKPLFYFVYRFC